MSNNDKVGFVCAYTPLPLLHAAGLAPYRILPIGEAPDQAGSLLHDNLCPHIKRLLDRALVGALPELEGVVIMASCDAMRRLADAWAVARPGDRLALVDLPTGRDEGAQAYFAGALSRLSETLSGWTGRQFTSDGLAASMGLYERLAEGLTGLERRSALGSLPGGRAALQALLIRAVTEPPERSLEIVEELAATPAERSPAGVPLFLFGNVLPDPEAMELFASCGAHIVSDDLCTGIKQFPRLELAEGADPLQQLARALLHRSPCARTLDAHQPLGFADQLVTAAKNSGAQGVIAHVMKFCDPYLARLPAARSALRAANIPMLALEGDCTLRSLGQHRTRIEAFVEMLEEGSP